MSANKDPGSERDKSEKSWRVPVFYLNALLSVAHASAFRLLIYEGYSVLMRFYVRRFPNGRS